MYIHTYIVDDALRERKISRLFAAPEYLDISTIEILDFSIILGKREQNTCNYKEREIRNLATEFLRKSLETTI